MDITALSGRHYLSPKFTGFFLGTIATLARDVPASAAFYASYELIQRALAPNGDRYNSQLPHLAST